MEIHGAVMVTLSSSRNQEATVKLQEQHEKDLQKASACDVRWTM